MAGDRQLSWRGRYAPPLPTIGGPAGATASETFQGVYSLTEGFVAKVGEVKGDKRFTDQHKREQIAAEALRTYQRLRDIEREKLPAVQKLASAARANLRPIPPRAKDDLVGQLREMEVRSFVRSLPAEERQNFLMRGLLERNETVISAFVNAPDPAVLGTNREILQRLVELATKELRPEDVASAEDVEKAAEALERQMFNARHIIAEAAGIGVGELDTALARLDRAKREEEARDQQEQEKSA